MKGRRKMGKKGRMLAMVGKPPIPPYTPLYPPYSLPKSPIAVLTEAEAEADTDYVLFSK